MVLLKNEDSILPLKKEGKFVHSTVVIPNLVHRNTLAGDLLANPILSPLAKVLLAKANENNPIALSQNDADGADMMAAMMKYLPLRAMVNFSQGAFTEEMLEEMIYQLNEYLGKKDPSANHQ